MENAWPVRSRVARPLDDLDLSLDVFQFDND